MASSIIGGLLDNGHPAACIAAADPYQPSLDNLQARWDVRVFADNAAAAEDADVVILAVKPQVMAEAAARNRRARTQKTTRRGQTPGLQEAEQLCSTPCQDDISGVDEGGQGAHERFGRTTWSDQAGTARPDPTAPFYGGSVARLTGSRWFEGEDSTR